MASKQKLPIGAAARLTGLSAHTLRKWEDRYAAVIPERTPGGDRRYSAEDIERSLKLKALVKSGQAIRSIAGLSTRELDRMLSALESPILARSKIAVSLLGDSGGQSIWQQRARLQCIEIVRQVSEIESLAGVNAEVLVFEVPSLTSDVTRTLTQIRMVSGIEAIVVLYKFGSLTLAEDLSDHRTSVLGLPINYRELERAIFALAGPGVPAQLLANPSPSRFSRTVLADIAQISSSVACECPRHVAHLLIDLFDFEAYSQECEDLQNDDTALHNMLRRTAATARILFESALIEIAQAEDIDLETLRG